MLDEVGSPVVYPSAEAENPTSQITDEVCILEHQHNPEIQMPAPMLLD